jgi:hypothetical protein
MRRAVGLVASIAIATASPAFAQDAGERYWIERAASCGDSDAALEAARLALQARGPSAGTIADRWLEKASDREEADFQWKAGKLLIDECYVGDSVKWLRRAMAGGNRKAAVALGRVYEGWRNGADAFDAVKHASDDDWLALISYRGLGNFPGDHIRAGQLFRSAANAGDVRAAVSLAEMLQRGDGVDKDLREARKLLEKSAAAGNRQASADLQLLNGQHEISKRFRTKPPDGCMVATVADGVVSIFSDRIEITIDHLAFSNPARDAENVQNFTIGLGRLRPGECRTLWTVGTESTPFTVEHVVNPGEVYTVPTPVHLRIARDAATRIDDEWLAFSVNFRVGANSFACFAHVDQYLLSNEVPDLNRVHDDD